MSFKINMTRFAGQKLLIAPLDWGLGHATRCIPIISALLQQDCKIWLAGEGAQEVLLRKEFPQLPFLSLPGYKVSYGPGGMIGKILGQVPKILKAIMAENTWLNDQIGKYGFDTVISDNRYGLYHKNVNCIFITHQLCIKSPWGKWSERVLQRQNYKFINRFSECWVPDNEGDDPLAGELSHPDTLPSIPVKYIGPLSRFEKSDTTIEKDSVLVMLSGPEPQRTILEKKILEDLKQVKGDITLVRGLPGEKEIPAINDRIRVYNHLPAIELQNEIEKAEWVIGRCGYSTVMDLAALQKKSILIPTPGQTEQEYLARHLMKTGKAFCINQNEFSFATALEKAKKFVYRITK